MVRRPLAGLLVLVAVMGYPTSVVAQLDQADCVKTYEAIWETVDPELWEAVNDLRSTTPAWYPDRAESKVFVEHLHVIERLVDATRLAPTPAPAESNEGWSNTTADQRNYRRTSYAFWVDACRLIAEGDPDGAAGRVAALIRLARQLAAEPQLSATAVASGCIQLAEELTDLVCASPSLTETGRRELLQAVTALDADDPAGFKNGLSGAERLVQWIARTFTGPDAGAKLVESLPIPEERKRPLAEGEEEERGRRGWGGRRGGGMWPSRELVTQLHRMDEKEVQEAAKDFQIMFDAAMRVWHDEDAVTQLERLDLAAARDGFGPLARLIPQWFSRQRRNADRVEESIGKMRLALIARQ